MRPFVIVSAGRPSKEIPVADRVTNSSKFGSVQAVSPAQIKVVRYIDKEGNDETRLVVKAAGDYYLLREKVGNSMLLQKANSWLQEGIRGYKRNRPEPEEGGNPIKAAS